MPAVGAAVFVKGTVEEYFALTRLSSVTEVRTELIILSLSH
jgi:predicted extracellular nuclease